MFVGHSVSAMIGVLASMKAPTMSVTSSWWSLAKLYRRWWLQGWVQCQQIDELLASLDDNHMGWSAAMAPAIMGNGARPELARN